jgi:hypothetical protein
MRMAALAGLMFAALPITGALADSIDGNWCHTDGRRMRIDGPRIITPTGVTTQGDYGRHSFSYVVPAGGPGAGMTIQMQLLGEIRVRVQEGSAPSAIWERCGPEIS